MKKNSIRFVIMNGMYHLHEKVHPLLLFWSNRMKLFFLLFFFIGSLVYLYVYVLCEYFTRRVVFNSCMVKTKKKRDNYDIHFTVLLLFYVLLFFISSSSFAVLPLLFFVFCYDLVFFLYIHIGKLHTWTQHMYDFNSFVSVYSNIFHKHIYTIKHMWHRHMKHIVGWWFFIAFLQLNNCSTEYSIWNVYVFFFHLI